jgi:hypothetical protein
MQNIIKLFSISGTMALVLATGTGCLKDKLSDDGLTNPNIGGSPKVIEIPGPVRATTSYNSSYAISLPISTKDTTFDVVYIRLAADQPASEDIQVQLELDTKLLDAYNDSSGTSLVQPAASLYSFDNANLVVTIPRGQRQGSLKMKVVPEKIATGQFGFGFKIKSVSNSGYLISGNFGNAVAIVGVRNIYDGVYDYKGYALRAGDAALTGNFTGAEMELQTTGPSSLIFGELALWGDGQSGIGIEKPELAINPVTNKVTVTSAGGAINNPNYDSRYDPATKTFFVSFTWGAGPAARLSIDTLTYREPRP